MAAPETSGFRLAGHVWVAMATIPCDPAVGGDVVLGTQFEALATGSWRQPCGVHALMRRGSVGVPMQLVPEGEADVFVTMLVDRHSITPRGNEDAGNGAALHAGGDRTMSTPRGFDDRHTGGAEANGLETEAADVRTLWVGFDLQAGTTADRRSAAKNGGQWCRSRPSVK